MNEKGPSGPLAPDPGPDRFDDIHIDDAWVGEDRTDPPGPLDRLRSLVLSPAGILCLVLLGAAVLSGLWYLTASREKESPELSLDAYLGTSSYLALPDIGAQTVYRAEYACVLPWDLPEGKKFLASLKKHE